MWRERWLDVVVTVVEDVALAAPAICHPTEIRVTRSARSHYSGVSPVDREIGDKETTASLTHAKDGCT